MAPKSSTKGLPSLHFLFQLGIQGKLKRITFEKGSCFKSADKEENKSQR